MATLEADFEVLAQVKLSLTRKQWHALSELLEVVRLRVLPFDVVLLGLDIAGVHSDAVPAIGRVCCPEAYRAWVKREREGQ